MTREEAIGNLKYAIGWNDMPVKEAMEMAIKALEQEPCDVPDINAGDIISRQAAIDAIDVLYLDGDSPASHLANAEGDTLIGKYQAITALDDLPSVKPQEPKTGHWINNQNGTFECDQCGYKHSKSRFCPNCGTKMQEGEE